MTLIIGLGNEDYFIQVSDRRLSTNGQPTTEEYNKASVVNFDNFRLLCGFTGLATYGTHDTHKLLLELVLESGPPDYQPHSSLERFKVKLIEFFKNSPQLKKLSAKEKRLSIMFSGYNYNLHPPLGLYAIITNFQNFKTGIDNLQSWKNFESTYWHENRSIDQQMTFIQVIGNRQLLNTSDENALREMLESRRPAFTLIQKSIAIIRKISDNANGTVGKQISSLVLSSDPKQAVMSNYHSDTRTNKQYYPSSINIKKSGLNMIIRNPEVEELGKVIIPKVGRNERCPCKSGKKYKRCHGK